MNHSITYAAMDTHKKLHNVAVHYPGEEQILRFTVASNTREIRKMVRKITKRAGGDVHFCYEAGVCGFALKRTIEALGPECVVIAPSLVPKKPGDRVKTDRRDALKLLAMFEAGLLTEVHAPQPEQEAARELTRCRQAARDNLKRIRHQLDKLCVRHGYIYCDGDNWTARHITWLRSLEFDQSLLADVFDSYFTEMHHCMQRLDRLDKQVEQLAQSKPYKAIVGQLRCFHGIETLTAITIITEIFDFGRFSTAGQLMSYLGLTPSESSSGQKQHRGPITKSGNKRIRSLLIETAWHYRHQYRIGKALKRRRLGQPQWAIDIADDAGMRLRRRRRHLTDRGMKSCKVTVAVARELSGFIWSLLQEHRQRNASSTT